MESTEHHLIESHESQWRKIEDEKFNKEIASFLSNTNKEAHLKYLRSHELHYSGDGDALPKINAGIAPIGSVEMLYEEGEPTQLHIMFKSEKGHSVDVYVRGGALKDFLSSQSSL